MLGSSARLVDPTTGQELVSYGAFSADGRLEQLDLGFPQARESAVNRSGAHGVLDTTRWSGARAITMQIVMPEPPNTDIAVDNLAGLMNPALRLWLYVQRPNWDRERRILVRGGTFTCPPGVLRRAQAGMVAAGAVFEDILLSSELLRPIGTGTGGLTLPVTLPVSLDNGEVAGSANVTVGGNAPAPFQLDMYGPCSDPLFRCTDTNEQIKFTGLTLAAGDFLRVDTGAGTAFLNNLQDQSRMNRLDFVTSNIQMMLPANATSQVVFSPLTPAGNCQAILSWRSRYF